MTNAPRLPSRSGSFFDMTHAECRRTRYMPIKLTPSVISNGFGFAGPSRPIVRSAQPTPAQLTTKRSSPSDSTAASTAVLTLSSSCTSVSKKGTPPPSFGGFKSATTTFAPRAFRASAVAAPSPDEPPTTSAPNPSIFIRRDTTKRCTFPPDGGFVRLRGGESHPHAAGLPARPPAPSPRPPRRRRSRRTGAPRGLSPRAVEGPLPRAAGPRGHRRVHRRLRAPERPRRGASRLHRRRVLRGGGPLFVPGEGG